MKKTSMPQNYKKDIDWIIDAYELAQVAFSDGFQKDAIQNASGARATDKWDGWKCKIDLTLLEVVVRFYQRNEQLLNETIENQKVTFL